MHAALVSMTLVLTAAVTQDEFTNLHRQLEPKSETWMTVPWKLSVLEARKVAAAEQKPIFIWAMDGHPLGCT